MDPIPIAMPSIAATETLSLTVQLLLSGSAPTSG
jgi:hypothetical protein